MSNFFFGGAPIDASAERTWVALAKQVQAGCLQIFEATERLEREYTINEIGDSIAAAEQAGGMVGDSDYTPAQALAARALHEQLRGLAESPIPVGTNPETGEPVTMTVLQLLTKKRWS